MQSEAIVAEEYLTPGAPASHYHSQKVKRKYRPSAFFATARQLRANSCSVNVILPGCDVR